MSNQAAEVQPSETPQPPPPGGIAYWPASLGVCTTLLALDHLTKWLAIAHLKPEWWGVASPTAAMWADRPRVVLIPEFLQLQYAENLGAAFSILYGHTFLLGIVSLVATGLLVWFWRSLPANEIYGRIAVAMVLSGAIGNMIDRLFRGYVVDFIDAHWFYKAHWPTFNVADSAICVGAVIISIRFLKGKI
ncbi:signal peptidase II [bacterium]|nr:signal peptidase II [bacterium]